MPENRLEDVDVDVDEVADPDEYIEQRRLKDIYDAKRQLLKARRDASELRIEAKYNGKKKQLKAAQELHREAAESYFLELSSLFHRNELGKEIWYKFDFGEVTVYPPKVRTDSFGRKYLPNSDPGPNGDVIVSMPDPTSYELVGIESLFNLPSQITEEFEFTVEKGCYGKVKRTKTSSAMIRKDTLDNMVKQVDLYLDEIGLDLDDQQGLPETELEL